MGSDGLDDEKSVHTEFIVTIVIPEPERILRVRREEARSVHSRAAVVDKQ